MTDVQEASFKTRSGVTVTGHCNTNAMHGNEAVTDIDYSTDVRTTERWVADADRQNIVESPTDGGYLCSDPISTYYIFTILMTRHSVV